MATPRPPGPRSPSRPTASARAIRPLAISSTVESATCATTTAARTRPLAALGDGAGVAAKHQHVDRLKGVPRRPDGEERRRQRTTTRSTTAISDPSRLRVQHRRFFGREERRQRSGGPVGQQQAERRAAERDGQALDDDLTNQHAAARAERELDGELAPPGRAPRQQQAAGVDAGAEQQQSGRAEHDRADQQDLRARADIQPRVAGGDEPSRFFADRCACPCWCPGNSPASRRVAASSSRAASSSPWPFVKRPTSDSRRSPRGEAVSAGEQRDPDVARPPELQAGEARRRNRRDDVIDATDVQLLADGIGRPAEQRPQRLADDGRRPGRCRRGRQQRDAAACHAQRSRRTPARPRRRGRADRCRRAGPMPTCGIIERGERLECRRERPQRHEVGIRARTVRGAVELARVDPRQLRGTGDAGRRTEQQRVHDAVQRRVGAGAERQAEQQRGRGELAACQAAQQPGGDRRRGAYSSRFAVRGSRVRKSPLSALIPPAAASNPRAIACGGAWRPSAIAQPVPALNTQPLHAIPPS